MQMLKWKRKHRSCHKMVSVELLTSDVIGEFSELCGICRRSLVPVAMGKGCSFQAGTCFKQLMSKWRHKAGTLGERCTSFGGLVWGPRANNTLENHEAAADRTLLQGHSHWNINILYNSTSGIHSQYHVKIKKEISKPREVKLRAMNQISKTWKLIVCFDVFFCIFLF